MRLSHVVVYDDDRIDIPLALRTSREAYYQEKWKMPSVMVVDIKRWAESFFTNQDFVSYYAMCLLVVQERPPGETAETLHLRIELERIFFDLLYQFPV